MKKLVASFLLLIACAAAFTGGFADDYPTKPVRMIVPFPAGGPADIVATVCGQHLAGILGQPIVKPNRFGAAPDGYTLISSATVERPTASTAKTGFISIATLHRDDVDLCRPIALVANIVRRESW